MLPIFQSIYVGFVQVRANLFALDTIQEEISLSKQFFFKDKDEETISIQFKEEILLKNVTFYFDDKSKNAVKDINLKIIPNSITYIIGPSGSGKSTLLDLILGLLFPKKGEISIDGINLTNQNSSAWHKNIGYVGQSIFLIDDTLKNNVTFRDFKSFNEEKFNKAIELSNVNDFLKDLPNGVDTIVGERGLKLSGGQRQRIAIARALYQDKSILFFDEATVSLDGISENYIIEKLKMLSKTKTIIIVTHNIKLLKDASLIYLLSNGEIIKKGKFKDFENNELFNKLLNEKNKANILITGGAGFIGSYIVKLFLKKNFSVINIDKLTYASNRKNLKDIEKLKNYKFIKADIANFHKLKNIIKNINLSILLIVLLKRM